MKKVFTYYTVCPICGKQLEWYYGEQTHVTVEQFERFLQTVKLEKRCYFCTKSTRHTLIKGVITYL